MKRITLITDYFRPEPGGLEGLFTGVARNWQSQFADVIVTSGDKNYRRSRADRLNFDVNEKYSIFRLEREQSLLAGLIQRKFFEEQLRRRIENFSPDHLLIGHVSGGLKFALKSISRLNLPYSIFLTGSDYKNKLNFVNFKERRFVMGAKNIFCLSRYLARGVRGLGIPQEKIAIIPPGMTPHWNSSLRKTKFDQVLKQFSGKKILISVGPLIPRKGLDRAIEALYFLLKKHQELHLVILGSGPEFSYLEELIRIRGLSASVTMTGFVNGVDFFKFMRSADIFLQPGCEREDDIEGTGTALIEAAWFGLPAVVGKIGIVDEIVKNRISGIVVNNSDADNLVEKINQLIESPELLSRLGRNAREIASGEFNMRATCQAIMSRI